MKWQAGDQFSGRLLRALRRRPCFAQTGDCATPTHQACCFTQATYKFIQLLKERMARRTNVAVGVKRTLFGLDESFRLD